MSNANEFRTIFNKECADLYAPVLVYAHRNCWQGDRWLDNAEDLTQHGFARSWKYCQRLELRAPSRFDNDRRELRRLIKAFAFKAIKRRMIDQLRRGGRDPEFTPIDEVDTEDCGDLRAQEARETLQAIRQALTGKELDFFDLLCELGDGQMKEIAHRMEISPSQTYRYAEKVRLRAMAIVREEAA
jgi:RNA polymerase sigma factor (sigma-70 family)